MKNQFSGRNGCISYKLIDKTMYTYLYVFGLKKYKFDFLEAQLENRLQTW